MGKYLLRLAVLFFVIIIGISCVRIDDVSYKIESTAAMVKITYKNAEGENEEIIVDDASLNEINFQIEQETAGTLLDLELCAEILDDENSHVNIKIFVDSDLKNMSTVSKPSTQECISYKK
ncbi:MAG: hypothetical protein GY754_08850 [bacterium]|nr:hypothetical protein [bacterium]